MSVDSVTNMSVVGIECKLIHDQKAGLLIRVGNYTPVYYRVTPYEGATSIELDYQKHIYRKMKDELDQSEQRIKNWGNNVE